MEVQDVAKAMTSSSSPGISLKQEGISYIAGAELPCLIVNVMRGGPGLGTIQPSQADYFQTVKGGGHGDYRLITLAPSSVQEMADFVGLGFDLAFKYNNPAMILADGIIGQMMEKSYFLHSLPAVQTTKSAKNALGQLLEKLEVVNAMLSLPWNSMPQLWKKTTFVFKLNTRKLKKTRFAFRKLCVMMQSIC